MRKIVVALLMVCAFLNANDQVCKGCHSDIYKEYYDSQHSRSHIKDDEIFKAVFAMHPESKSSDPSCNACHNSHTDQNRGIGCVDCHQVASVHQGVAFDTNEYTKKEKYLFSKDLKRKNEKVEFEEESGFLSMFKSTKGSPYHTIDFGNENYYNANVCMGCHKHNTNAMGIDACRIEKSTNASGDDCISCHMPQVQGTATSIKITQTHAFHGFAGAHTKPNMLKKYLQVELQKNSDSFEVILHNSAPHPFLLQPLRVAVLKVSILKADGSIQKLSDIRFQRVLAKDNIPAMPWEADGVLQDTMLQAGEKRAIKYESRLGEGDKVEVEFGYLLVNEKMAPTLGAKDEFVSF
jgi:nitrate/TMAO reductase-like tetraheme cytochrome c subunit